MPVDVQERCLGQDPDAAPAAAPEVGEPRGLRRHRTIVERDAPDALHRDERFQILTAQRLDHGERPSRDRVPVAAKRFQIDGQAQLVHFGVVHPGAHVAPHELHPPEPFLVVEHLRPIGDEAVHAHVLDPRRAPEEPGDRVDSRIWAAAHLVLGEPGEEILDEAAVKIPVTQEKEAEPIHGTLARLETSAPQHDLDVLQRLLEDAVFHLMHYFNHGRRDRCGDAALTALGHHETVHVVDLRGPRSEEHTSELQSLAYLVCRLLLEKKKKKNEHDILPEGIPITLDSITYTSPKCRSAQLNRSESSASVNSPDHEQTP